MFVIVNIILKTLGLRFVEELAYLPGKYKNSAQIYKDKFEFAEKERIRLLEENSKLNRINNHNNEVLEGLVKKVELIELSIEGKK